MKKLIITILIILLMLLSFLYIGYYNVYLVYNKATKISFDQVLDNPSDKQIYYFYIKDGSNTNSIDSRIRAFYLECINLGIDFEIIDMSIKANDEYISVYPNEVGVNPYPDVSDIKTYEDIFITQIPAMMYVLDDEVIYYDEGAASVVYLMNDVLSDNNSELVLDTR